MSWLRLTRTLLPLRPSQIAWRLRYLLRRKWEASPASRIRERTARRVPASLTVQPPVSVPEPPHAAISPAERLAELQDHRLTLLNEQRPFQGGEDWCMIGGRTSHRLWVYTLHGHAWLWDLARGFAASGDPAYAVCLVEYLTDWLRSCHLGLPGFTHYPWNSYAIATRLGHWYRTYHTLPSSFWVERPQLHREFLESMALQASYLQDHLEWDLRGNHLLVDAVGLAWTGRFFAEGGTWLETATRLAVEQAKEQILPDGGHFERSPMYHLRVMEDLFALALLVEAPPARDRLREAWRRMAEFLVWMRHPDGDLALFNDGSLCGTQTVEHTLDLGKLLGVAIDTAPRRGGAYFPQTGLVVWHGDPWTIFLDVGPVGPDYQPGHAHADTLALECSFKGQRLFVDPGTYAYDLDVRRRYDRSTAAHNTVCVDERDSSEVWHIFRVGRRAYPRDVQVDFSGGGMRASAAHDGYDHLPGRPRHARCVSVGPQGSLTVSDSVTGRDDRDVQGGFLLSPEWTATSSGGGWLLENGGRSVRVTVRGPEGIALSEERRPYHPEYGREVQTTRLTWRVRSRLPVEVHTVVEGV